MPGFRPNVRVENQFVNDRFKSELDKMPFNRDLVEKAKMLISPKPDIIADIPYWVAESLHSKIDLNILRTSLSVICLVLSTS